MRASIVVIGVMIVLAGSCDTRIEAGESAGGPVAPLVPEGPHVRPIPTEEPVDEARAALGERLFADPRLSHDRTVACTSCHDLADGGDAGNARTALAGRTQGPINVPTVFNVRYQFRWSWTGRFASMDDQIDAAMRAPHAMATATPDALELVRPYYASDFDRVYPDVGLNVDTFHDAMTEYLYSLTTPDAPFDRFLRGEPSALDLDARAGWEIFQDYGCVSCHQGINVGGNMFQRFGVMDDYFARPRESLPSDDGRCAFTHEESDCHVFRVPSLRNVALTAPYFHDGSAPTLEDAVQVMAHFQLGRPLTEIEVRRLVAFLRSLTGRQPGART
jgi:cytochrome c peroxidase